MAAKHDGKRAAANMWVTQQNLAREKGGRPKYQQPVKKGKKNPPPAPPPEAESKSESKPESKSESKPESKSESGS